MVRTFCLMLLAAAMMPGADDGWTSLFDGKSLGQWKETQFQRRPGVKVEGGAILLSAGAPLNGVNFTGATPKQNYEVRFEARRVKGNDFFAALTFPVEDSHATLVTGGWGGDIVGISNIDGWDAADNETRTYVTFENERWYKFVLRVTPEKLQVWIDDEQTVNVGIEGRKISLRRGEATLSAPFGFASYNTTGEIRNIEIRRLAN